MIRYIVKRILIMIPVLLAVIVIVFTLTHFMPGDPVRVMLGSNYTQEQYDLISARLGLDQPFLTQLWNYIYNLVVHQDFGTSYTTGNPVMQELSGRIWISFKIGLLSCIFTTALAIPLGILSAVKQNSVLDYIVSFFSILIAALPNFWVALMCIIVFCIQLGWLPANGLTGWDSYILPVLCNGTLSIAVTTRQMRSSMLDVISQDYIRTARSKGLSNRETIMHHGLKNAMLPVLTVLGSQFSMIIGGSVVIENIFGIPGIGSKLISAINSRDYSVVLAIVILICAFSMAVLLIVDILFAFVDPRIKAQFENQGRQWKKKAKAQTVPANAEGASDVMQDHEERGGN